ncbi:hypothetical protein E2K93_00330 [Thalassotalea sp. HSM 43]|nr:hypothetical protein E2K93_00330 [Thalassotalea sp. HSM 43]
MRNRRISRYVQPLPRQHGHHPADDCKSHKGVCPNKQTQR